MRVVFFGSPDFSVPTLRRLDESSHEVALVVTRPDRPRGRGRKPAPTAVGREAAERGLEVMKPKTVNAPEPIGELRRVGAELGVLVAYGEILSPEVLGATERGFLNVHPSLLPDYRGAAPINWALIRGEEVTGVSVIRMSPELDAGPIVAEREVPIDPDETAGDLAERLARIGADACLEVLDRLAAGEEVEERPQPREGGFFARKLTKEDGRVEWGLPAEAIRNQVRGLTPWPGAYTTFYGDEREVRVTLVSVGAAREESGEKPGTVVGASEERGLRVAAGEGVIEVQRLKPAGGREMSAVDFINGYGVEVGDRFE
jgi:methionyl-tRNA formyltransferase